VLADELELDAKALFACYTELTLTTPYAGVEHDTITILEALDAGTQAGHLSRAIGSRDVRHRNFDSGDAANHP